MLTNLNWNIVGLTLNVIGVFFLASSIVYRRPRRLLQEFFGVEKTGSLTAVREYLINKIQVYIGFLFLIGGYVVQIGVLLAHERETGERVVEQENFLIVVALLVVSIIGVTILLKILQLFWAHRYFRRLLADFMRENEWPLGRHPSIAEEIGELLEIPKVKGESIDDYIKKIEKVLAIKRSTRPSTKAPV